MPRVLSAAGWDKRFSPSPGAMQEWSDALSARRTVRPTLVSLAFAGVLAVWARWFPGRAIPAMLAVLGVGFFAVMAFAVRNMRARTRAEMRLLAEYESWTAASGNTNRQSHD